MTNQSFLSMGRRQMLLAGSSFAVPPLLDLYDGPGAAVAASKLGPFFKRTLA